MREEVDEAWENNRPERKGEMGPMEEESGRIEKEMKKGIGMGKKGGQGNIYRENGG